MVEANKYVLYLLPCSIFCQLVSHLATQFFPGTLNQTFVIVQHGHDINPHAVLLGEAMIVTSPNHNDVQAKGNSNANKKSVKSHLCNIRQHLKSESVCSLQGSFECFAWKRGCHRWACPNCLAKSSKCWIIGRVVSICWRKPKLWKSSCFNCQQKESYVSYGCIMHMYVAYIQVQNLCYIYVLYINVLCLPEKNCKDQDSVDVLW